MEPVGSELFVMLRDPQLRERVLNQTERRTSTETQATDIDRRFRPAQGLRVLTSHVSQFRSAIERVGSRQRAIVH
jgi:hypothetical protein